MTRDSEPHPHGGGCCAVWSEACFVPPSPELRARLDKELNALRKRVKSPLAERLALDRKPRPLGLDDGVIVPPDQFPPGTAMSMIRNAAAERAPLRGAVRVVVVLVDFSDRTFGHSQADFEKLFFSLGSVATGSVREYYREVTNGLVDIQGEVVGPYRMPQTLAWYANGNFGIGRPTGTTRARDMAHDAVVAADPNVNFAPYDNDGNGFVDAFIVVHAGSGGEETGLGGDIWSHKWTMPSAYAADGTQVFGYLTIPEDAKVGVCSHELGHLLFGFPDLYDTDDTSEGIGDWCLMAAGSWNGGGDRPAHPSAWCKVGQGWASVTNVTASGALALPDVKASHQVHRMWRNGGSGPEYFLLENRQRTGFDDHLPGDGLLIWHIDEGQTGNTDETHYKVALMQADGKRNLELKANRGDAGDPYPGTAGATAFTASTTPSSHDYAGADTCVAVEHISTSGPAMSADVRVTCGKSPLKDAKDAHKEHKELGKDAKDAKDARKERKEVFKDVKDARKEHKELGKDVKETIKDGKEIKETIKDGKEFKESAKDGKELDGWPPQHFGFGQQGVPGPADSGLEARVAALEAALGGGAAEPFVAAELRPDLLGGPAYADDPSQLQARMAAGDAAAKREFDAPPP